MPMLRQSWLMRNEMDRRLVSVRYPLSGSPRFSGGYCRSAYTLPSWSAPCVCACVWENEDMLIVVNLSREKQVPLGFLCLAMKLYPDYFWSIGQKNDKFGFSVYLFLSSNQHYTVYHHVCVHSYRKSKWERSHPLAVVAFPFPSHFLWKVTGYVASVERYLRKHTHTWLT